MPDAPDRSTLARLASPDEDERYRACDALLDGPGIDEAEARALLVALGDKSYGVETVPDHAGGYQDDAVAIADVASRALRKHGGPHRKLIEDAWTDPSTRSSALANVITALSDAEHILALTKADDPRLRRAAVQTMRRLLNDFERRWIPGSAIDPELVERGVPFARAVLAATADTDRDVRGSAYSVMESESTGFERAYFPKVFAAARG